MITYGPDWDEARLRRTVQAVVRLSEKLRAATLSGGLEITVTSSYDEDGETHPVRLSLFQMRNGKRGSWIEPDPEARARIWRLASSCGMRGLPESVANPASRFRSSSPPTGESVRIVLRTPESATARAAEAVDAIARRGEDERIAASLKLEGDCGLLRPWNRRRVERAALAIARSDPEIGTQVSGRAIRITLAGPGTPGPRAVIDCDAFYEAYDPDPEPGRAAALLGALARAAVAPGATFEILLGGDPPSASGRAALAARRGGPANDARIVRRIEAALASGGDR